MATTDSRALVHPTGETPVSMVDFERQMHRSRRRLLIGGLAILVLGFGGLGGWAALAPLKSATLAQGVVKVAGERKTVQHLEGGIVREILVRENESVQAGQVLVRLEDITTRARLAMLQAERDALTAELTRLESELAGRTRLAFPAELEDRRTDPVVARVLEGETQLFDSRRTSLAGQIDVFRQRQQQAQERIAGRMTELATVRTKLGYITEEIRGAESLLETGMYLKTRYYALKRAEADLDGDIGRLSADISETRALIGESDLQILNLRNQHRKDANDRLQDIRSRLRDVAERGEAAADALSRVEIVAPLAGRVIDLQVHTRGGVIRPGAPILDIVPTDERLVVQARIAPEDIDRVHQDLPAEVRFTAFNTRTTPVYPGVVTRVSADRLTDPVRGAPYYLAQIEINPGRLPALALQPGMPAEVYIVTGERTALAYLTKPIREQIRRGMLER
ncbi:MAG: HlyD family type I secretion periplasmic adaptor subunit [Burkholderiales bacterium]|nr:HlyD family type I secretion periplasmic adaptor subunit [Burkholderiales bacterium]